MNCKSPIYLITGFLGSGKTTFIQQAIEYFSGKQKIAIVQNEFAPANIDGKELKRTTNADFDILEINNGSVFCVCLLSGFIESLHTFVSTYKPELILMEASGLSDPVSIGQIFNAPLLQNDLYLAGTVCIVDALNVSKHDKLVTRINHQIQIADIVLLNKSDLSTNPVAVSQRVSSINPFARQFITTHCRVAMDEVFTTDPVPPRKKFYIPGTSSKPDTHSLVFRSSKPLDHQRIDEFLKQLLPNTLRIKGYIYLNNQTLLSIQAIGDEIHTAAITGISKNTELIVIGTNVNTEYINALYKSHI
jgi:G3E family GTPase